MRRATWATIGGTAAGGLAAMLARRVRQRAHKRGRLIYRKLHELQFAESVPGASQAVLRGDPKHGAYAAITRFSPGATHPRHKHSHDIHLLVLSGAYIYRSNGQEIRVGAHEYLFLPAGDVHISAGDANEGCVFLEQSPGQFDLIVVD